MTLQSRKMVLSEQAIVEAALRVLKYHGAAGRLGVALGADPTALYRYFDGIEDVVLAAAAAGSPIAARMAGPLRGLAGGPDTRTDTGDPLCPSAVSEG